MRTVEGRQGKNNADKLEAVVSVPDPSSCPLVAVLTPEQGVASWTSSCSSAWRVITDNPVGVASLQKLGVVWVLWRRSRPRIQSGRARRLGFSAAESIWTTQSQLQDSWRSALKEKSPQLPSHCKPSSNQDSKPLIPPSLCIL